LILGANAIRGKEFTVDFEKKVMTIYDPANPIEPVNPGPGPGPSPGPPGPGPSPNPEQKKEEEKKSPMVLIIILVVVGCILITGVIIYIKKKRDERLNKNLGSYKDPIL